MKRVIGFIGCTFLIFAVFTIALPAFAQNIAGTWSTVSSNGFNPRYWFTSSVVSGKIYVIGGTNGAIMDTDVDVYDPTTDTWTTLATTGHFTPRIALTSCVYDGKIYVMGGSTGPETPANICNVVEVFDPGTNSWSTPQTSGTFTPRCVLASAVVNNKIFVIGGYNGSNDLSVLEVFNPATNTWSTPTTTGTFSARGAFPALVYDDKIYLVGGAENGTLPLFIQVFDPSTNAWSTLTVHGEFAGRCDHAAGVIGSKIYIMGGLYGGGFSPITTDAFQVFDLATNTWTTPAYSGSYTSRGYVSSAVAANKLYVMGGVDTVAGQPYCVNIVESFDPSTAAVDLGSASKNICLISPNPAVGKVLLTDVPEGSRITVSNMLGEVLLGLKAPSESTTTIDLSFISAGIYYIRIETGSDIITRSFVKDE